VCHALIPPEEPAPTTARGSVWPVKGFVRTVAYAPGPSLRPRGLDADEVGQQDVPVLEGVAEACIRGR